MVEPSAVVVADSISPEGHRLRSIQVTAHRFILAEINTHRMLSRSYRSSRAVPSKRLIEEVRTDPAMPVFWGANRPGMQAQEELSAKEKQQARANWLSAAGSAANHAELMAACGLHKQIANRVLEPFLWVHGIITATEWDNFFGLRLHQDAQPEFRALADAVWAAFKSSEPRRLEPGQWHLPYVDGSEYDLSQPWKPGDDPIRVSVARCARASYSSFETGARSTLDEDLALYERLVGSHPIHASPAEHQATPDGLWHNPGFGRKWANPKEHGNFVGWRQYRKTLKGEAVAPIPEGYDASPTA